MAGIRNTARRVSTASGPAGVNAVTRSHSIGNHRSSRVKDVEPESLPILEEMRRMLSDVERKAFELFQHRGASPGHALDDWLQAERETLAAPPAELIETPNSFALRMAVPGFSAKQIQVTAAPRELIITAEHPARETPTDALVVLERAIEEREGLSANPAPCCHRHRQGNRVARSRHAAHRGGATGSGEVPRSGGRRQRLITDRSPG